MIEWELAPTGIVIHSCLHADTKAVRLERGQKISAHGTNASMKLSMGSSKQEDTKKLEDQSIPARPARHLPSLSFAFHVY